MAADPELRGGTSELAAAAPMGPRGRRWLGPVAPYAELFADPGPRRFVAAGFVARLTVSMAGLGLILALSGGHGGGYALAGAVAGVFGLANAFASPRVGRLHDRHGQARVLPPVALVFGASMLLVIAAIGRHWPSWSLFPPVIAAGASMPLVGSLVRARWTRLYAGTDRLRTCYALEGATEEVVYIVGPVLVTLLATSAGPLAGLTAMLCCAVGGTLALAPQRGTQPEPSAPAGTGGGPGAMRFPAMRTLFTAMLGVGGVFGSMEIVTVGYASAHGSRGASGLLLGIWGVSSMVAGLVYGAARISAPLHRRFVAAVAVFAAGLLPLMLARGLPSLAVLLVIAGPAMSLVLVTGVEMVERVVPAASLTEGIAWSSGGIGFGMTAGSLTGGWSLDTLGAAHGYAVPAAFGMLALVVVLAGHGTLRAGSVRRS